MFCALIAGSEQISYLGVQSIREKHNTVQPVVGYHSPETGDYNVVYVFVLAAIYLLE
jgi:hypothetical protein